MRIKDMEMTTKIKGPTSYPKCSTKRVNREGHVSSLRGGRETKRNKENLIFIYDQI